MYTDEQVQKIFNKVIEARFYGFSLNGFYSSRFMCCALENAADAGVISFKECDIGKFVIQQYLGSYPSLKNFLDARKLPAALENRLAIYKNWRARPYDRQLIKNPKLY